MIILEGGARRAEVRRAPTSRLPTHSGKQRLVRIRLVAQTSRISALCQRQVRGGTLGRPCRPILTDLPLIMVEVANHPLFGLNVR